MPRDDGVGSFAAEQDMLEYTGASSGSAVLSCAAARGFTTLLTDGDRSLYAYMRRTNSSSAIVV